MKEPKEMISTKDCMYISDILNVTGTMIKKLDHYDEEINDEKIKEFVAKTSLNLKDQYHKLLEVLK